MHIYNTHLIYRTHICNACGETMPNTRILSLQLLPEKSTRKKKSFHRVWKNTGIYKGTIRIETKRSVSNNINSLNPSSVLSCGKIVLTYCLKLIMRFYVLRYM